MNRRLSTILILAGLFLTANEGIAQSVAAEQQTLLVTIRLSSDSDVERVYALEDKISTVLKKASAGEFDGDEFGKGTCTLYMYGPSAQRLFDVVIPLIKEFHPRKGSYIVKQFGKLGARQDRIELPIQK
jgi:hypothetical protein